MIGAYLDEAAQKALFDHILKEAQRKPILDTPKNVEACLRVGSEDREVIILINHGDAPQTVNIPWQAYDHLSGRKTTKILMGAYGVAVLTRA